MQKIRVQITVTLEVQADLETVLEELNEMEYTFSSHPGLDVLDSELSDYEVINVREA